MGGVDSSLPCCQGGAWSVICVLGTPRPGISSPPWLPLTHSHGLLELLAVKSLILCTFSLPVLCQCCLLDSRTRVPGPVPPFCQPGKLTHPLPLTGRIAEGTLQASWVPLVGSSAMTYPLCLIVHSPVSPQP